MKLRMIAEGRRGLGMGHADDVARNQASKNLVVTTLSKLRNILEPMGLLQGSGQKHSVKQPIGDSGIGAAFNTLRNAVQIRVKEAAAELLAGDAAKASLWGFQAPSGWLDAGATQRGKANPDGLFDSLLRDVIKASDGQPLEGKAQLLSNLATVISTKF